MYKKGDIIVYGKSGVCIVDDICEVEFGIEGLCYKLRPYDDQQNAIYVSVDNDKIMMRNVISAEKAREIIDQMGECPAIFPKNDKERAELVKETLNSDDMSKWMQLLKGLYIEREKRMRMRKSLKYKDEKVFNFLENFIMGELSVALDIPKYKIYDMIAEKIKEYEKRMRAERRAERLAEKAAQEKAEAEAENSEENSENTETVEN
ncbi:MAG: CarD family transcriptional regulator [Oscillospiraceae bacterium]|nr:hypothetical protein [Oscillospiraceae bacterium]MDD6084865.1 CarD family transcriptional regulator [Oscillospiraceae bacterium]MDY3257541.1 CarD family transcriptional regulator [Ruminococcus callidus]